MHFPAFRAVVAPIAAAFLALLAGLPGTGRAAPRPVPVPRSALGINLGQVNYYNTQVAFLDLVKQAPDWGLGSGGQPPPVDAEGWPTSIAPGKGAGFMANVPRPGRYVALYQGEGDLRVDSGGKILNRKPGRIEIEFDGGPAGIVITRTDPTRPLRRLAIVPVANEKDHAKQLFEPRFLELVQPFGVVRMLDWLRINGSNQERWADRPKPEDFSQGTEKGAALEYALDICNRVHSDCWLLIPHKADDEYVTRFAETVRDRLDPSLKVYVEYSNEIWNFKHGDWCQQAGERLGMKKEWDTRLRFQAHRSLEIFRIFEKALGRERLVRVLAGQTWETRLRIVAEWEDAYKQADALAIAPYFCDELASDKGVGAIRALDPGSVAALCSADVARIRERVKKARALADRLGLPLVAYEGGQHVATSGALHGDKALQTLLDDANRHPDMGRAYARYYDMWRDEGGQLLAVYKLVEQSTRWGRWGLLENMWQSDDAAPKHKATLEFLARQKPWWGPPAAK